MKTVLRLLPAFLCCILMGAHFLRMGSDGQIPMILCLVFPFLLFLRKRWVRWIMWAALSLASVSWFLTALSLIAMRQQTGQPFQRLMYIFAGVVAFHALAFALLFGQRMKAYFYPAESAPSSS